MKAVGNKSLDFNTLLRQGNISGLMSKYKDFGFAYRSSARRRLAFYSALTRNVFRF